MHDMPLKFGFHSVLLLSLFLRIGKHVFLAPRNSFCDGIIFCRCYSYEFCLNLTEANLINIWLFLEKSYSAIVYRRVLNNNNKKRFVFRLLDLILLNRIFVYQFVYQLKKNPYPKFFLSSLDCSNTPSL